MNAPPMKPASETPVRRSKIFVVPTAESVRRMTFPVSEIQGKRRNETAVSVFDILSGPINGYNRALEQTTWMVDLEDRRD